MHTGCTPSARAGRVWCRGDRNRVPLPGVHHRCAGSFQLDLHVACRGCTSSRCTQQPGCALQPSLTRTPAAQADLQPPRCGRLWGRHHRGALQGPGRHGLPGQPCEAPRWRSVPRAAPAGVLTCWPSMACPPGSTPATPAALRWQAAAAQQQRPSSPLRVCHGHMLTCQPSLASHVQTVS